MHFYFQASIGSFQEEFVNSVEVSEMTEIPPPSISQIPPPIPVDASAFFQNGADYIQVDGDVKT